MKQTTGKQIGPMKRRRDYQDASRKVRRYGILPLLASFVLLMERVGTFWETIESNQSWYSSFGIVEIYQKVGIHNQARILRDFVERPSSFSRFISFESVI